MFKIVKTIVTTYYLHLHRNLLRLDLANILLFIIRELTLNVVVCAPVVGQRSC